MEKTWQVVQNKIEMFDRGFKKKKNIYKTTTKKYRRKVWSFITLVTN